MKKKLKDTVKKNCMKKKFKGFQKMLFSINYMDGIKRIVSNLQSTNQTNEYLPKISIAQEKNQSRQKNKFSIMNKLFTIIKRILYFQKKLKKLTKI